MKITRVLFLYILKLFIILCSFILTKLQILNKPEILKCIYFFFSIYLKYGIKLNKVLDIYPKTENLKITFISQIRLKNGI